MCPLVRDHIYKNDPEAGQQNIMDGQVFQVEGATVAAVHALGHSEDHMCFVLEEEKAMFTGDSILGYGTSAVEYLSLFVSSLQKMAGKNCITGYPAHGVTIDDLHGKIIRELASKWRGEEQVRGTLKRLRDQGESRASVKDLVTGIYGDSLDDHARTIALEPFIDEVLRRVSPSISSSLGITGNLIFNSIYRFL